MVWSTSICAIGLHYLRGNSLRQCCYYAADLNSPCAVIDRFALLGTILVIGYVLICAASFHHIDRFIGTTFLGLRWNWILEMEALLASQWRRRKQKRAA